MSKELPVAVIGAGPVGLAAAAHLTERDIPFVVYEAGDHVGASVSEWAHVRFFSPWRYSIDPAARRLLDAAGWSAPDLDHHPTGGEIVDEYLAPLAELPLISASLRFGHRVEAIGRLGVDKVKNAERDDRPFVVTAEGPGGRSRIAARAVIDATGTWKGPNPLGADGFAALGEDRYQDRIVYGIPDILGVARDRYAGRRIAVVGSGHSAQNTVRDLAQLQKEHPGTEVTWVIRRPAPGQMFGGGSDDQLPERGRLGADAANLVEGGQVRLVNGFRVDALEDADDGGIDIRAVDGTVVGPFDEIITATGFRPELSFLRELRLDLDPVLESTRALAPLIDPNFHSCGSVPPHGEADLRHPEPGVYLVGSKSYGRAPSFLLATGYEQVRSVVAQLAGDTEAARRVELILPETGVCSSSPTASSEDSAAAACCGPSPSAAEAPQATAEAEPVVAAEAPAAGCCGPAAPSESLTEPSDESASCCGSVPEPVPAGAAAGAGAGCCG